MTVAFVQGAKDDAQEQNQSNLVVGDELCGAIRRVVDVEGVDLMRQMGRYHSDGRIVGPRLLTHHSGRYQTADHCRRESTQPQLRVVSETDRSRFDSQQGVIHLVLMGVDRVVDDCPADTGRVQRQASGPIDRTLGGTPTQQGTPVEGHSQDQLWPVGYPLHQRIDDD